MRQTPRGGGREKGYQLPSIVKICNQKEISIKIYFGRFALVIWLFFHTMGEKRKKSFAWFEWSLLYFLSRALSATPSFAVIGSFQIIILISLSIFGLRHLLRPPVRFELFSSFFHQWSKSHFACWSCSVIFQCCFARAGYKFTLAQKFVRTRDTGIHYDTITKCCLRPPCSVFLIVITNPNRKIIQ